MDAPARAAQPRSSGSCSRSCSPRSSAGSSTTARSTSSPTPCATSIADGSIRRRHLRTLVFNGLLGPVLPPGEDLLPWPALRWPARSGCTALGLRRPRGCTATSERWTASRFLAAGVPLFFAGAALCYFILPKAHRACCSGSPRHRTSASIVDFNEYLSIVMRMMLVFGLAFELPVFIVLLNLARRPAGARCCGLVAADHPRGLRLRRRRDARPATRITMTALAAPDVSSLILAAYVSPWSTTGAAGERHRQLDYAELDDDETSPLHDRPTGVDPTDVAHERTRTTRETVSLRPCPAPHDVVRCAHDAAGPRMSREIALLVNPTAGKGRGARLLRAGRRPAASRRPRGRRRRRPGRGRGVRPGCATGWPTASTRWSPSAATAWSTWPCRCVAGTASRWASSPPARATTSPARSGCPRRRRGRRRPRSRGSDARPSTSARANGRWFGGVLGSGFDSMVNERANRMRWPAGAARYNLAIARRAAHVPADPVRARARRRAVGDRGDARRGRQRRSYGGGMRVCPGASSTTACSTSPCSGRSPSSSSSGSSRPGLHRARTSTTPR